VAYPLLELQDALGDTVEGGFGINLPNFLNIPGNGSRILSISDLQKDLIKLIVT